MPEKDGYVAIINSTIAMFTHDFYELLPSLKDFIDLVNPDYYTKVPADWYILITDVVGSTKAIDSGHYKDVNLLGACSIIAVLNAVDLSDLPLFLAVMAHQCLSHQLI